MNMLFDFAAIAAGLSTVTFIFGVCAKIKSTAGVQCTHFYIAAGAQRKRAPPQSRLNRGQENPFGNAKAKRCSFYSYEWTPAFVHNKHKSIRWPSYKRKPPSLPNVSEFVLPFPASVETSRISVILILLADICPPIIYYILLLSFASKNNKFFIFAKLSWRTKILSPLRRTTPRLDGDQLWKENGKFCLREY